MNCKVMCDAIVIIIVLTVFSETPAMSFDKANQRESFLGIDETFFQDGELTFGGDQHLNKLNIEGNIEEKNLGLYQNLKEKTISFHFDHSKCKSYKMNMGHAYVSIDGLEPFGLPGNPMIPMEKYLLELPKNAKIIEIGVVDGNYNEIKNELHIIPNPQPIFWSNFKTSNENKINRLIPNMDVYSSDCLFPGTTLSYNVGEDNKLTKVFIKFYPIQYMPRSGKTFLLSDGLIKLYYEVKEKYPDLSVSECSNNINIIIAPPSLYDPALQLKELHDGEGTLTDIVNTTWIYRKYEEAGDPPYPGYDNSTYIVGDDISNYNYSLAKKILAYLNDTANHSNLQYVTLLGNARLIPPSYYYEYYSTWVPTDFFYSSPDYDLVPNYKLGRLPVNNSEEAVHVINKIISWDASSDLFGNISVAAGKPFGTPYDIGEMIVTDSINQGLFRGIVPRKCYRTELSFDRLNLTKSLMGKTGILYHIGHGSGDALSLEGDPLDVEDIMNLPQSNTSPIVVSISCVNGAFDTNLVDLGFNLSFGESLLLSNSGGIAYIGGSRGNYGSPIFALDKGYLNIFKETYMAAMLTYLFEPFYNGTSKLGDLTSYASTRYVESHDFTDPIDKYTFFDFVLLGDPALQLPSRPTDIEYQTPQSYIGNKLTLIDNPMIGGAFFSIGSFGNGEIPLNVKGENMIIVTTTDSPDVDIKIIDALAFNNMILERVTMPTVTDNVSYDFTPDQGSLYSIRVVAKDGKEGWLFSSAARIVDDDYDDTTPGWGVTRWSALQNAIDISIDSDIIYVFNGTYKENVILDKAIKLIGANNIATVIDGGGYGEVVNITGYESIVTGFKITNSGRDIGDGGIGLRSKYGSAYNNIITDNRNGICVYSGNSDTILTNNTIINNMYGVYLNEGSEECIIFGNNICYNEYGLFLSNSCFSFVIGNVINANDYGIFLDKSSENYVMINNITVNKIGINLERSNQNQILVNNFIDNDRQAQFCNSIANIWTQNYWDKWVGLRLNLDLILPKIIFGRIGMGFVPWINIDPLPAKTPNDLDYFL